MAKRDVQQGTLALMLLKTLEVLGPLHGYGIARRIEQISGDMLAVNQGTLYPVLLRLEQEGVIASEWGVSDNNRRARFYRLTAAGRRQARVEAQEWEQTAALLKASPASVPPPALGGDIAIRVPGADQDGEKGRFPRAAVPRLNKLQVARRLLVPGRRRQCPAGSGSEEDQR